MTSTKERQYNTTSMNRFLLTNCRWIFVAVSLISLWSKETTVLITIQTGTIPSSSLLTRFPAELAGSLYCTELGRLSPLFQLDSCCRSTYGRHCPLRQGRRRRCRKTILALTQKQSAKQMTDTGNNIDFNTQLTFDMLQ